MQSKSLQILRVAGLHFSSLPPFNIFVIFLFFVTVKGMIWGIFKLEEVILKDFSV